MFVWSSIKWHTPKLNYYPDPLVARIGTKQNGAKEAPKLNYVKSPDLEWLNIDRFEDIKGNT